MVGTRTPSYEVPPGESSGAAAEEFAARFQASAHVLWLIAVGIVGDRAGAEDVVQESAIVALGKLDQFQAGTNFTAWMGQIVRYVALNHARKEHKATVRLDEDALERSAPPVRPADEAGEAGEARLGARGELPLDQDFFDDQVMRALRSLGEIARACLLLRTVEGLEYAEIAKILEIPEGTAMSHVHRSRQFLRERLRALNPSGRV